MLANILLHEVLDAWFQDEVKPRLRGQGTLVRYADDAVMMFSTEADAKRVFDVLPKRFAKYGLTLHPEKTKLVAFERPDRPYRTDRDDGPGPLRPGTFDFLGFTIRRMRKRGSNKWFVYTRPAKKAIASIKARVKTMTYRATLHHGNGNQIWPRCADPFWPRPRGSAGVGGSFRSGGA